MATPADNPLATKIPVWLLPATTTVPDAWYGCLDADERARAARFLRPTDRSGFVAAHVLVRALLTSVGRHAPADWAFTVDDNGKPRVAVDSDVDAPAFNITHTPGLVAAVADPGGCAAGIDAETCTRAIDPRVMSRVLSADERTRFQGLDAESARRELLQRWVLKEAVTKATGRGIALPFTRIGFERLTPPTVTFAPNAGLGHPGEWQIEAWCAGGTHRLAVALHCGDGPAPRIAARTLDPDELTGLLRSG